MNNRMNLFLEHLAHRYNVKSGKIPIDVIEQMKLYLIIEMMDQDDVIAEYPSCLVYRIYTSYCKKYGYTVTSAINFSRFLCRWFDYAVLSKRCNDKCRRIIVRCVSHTC